MTTRWYLAGFTLDEGLGMGVGHVANSLFKELDFAKVS